MKKALTTLLVSISTAAYALAQQLGGTITIGNTATQGQINGGPLIALLGLVNRIIVLLGPIAIGLAVLSFFWYLIKFIWGTKDDGDAKSKSMSGMGYSVLALFIMVSIWGIIGWLGSMLGIGQGGNIPIPGLPSGQ